jgi:predicted nucleotidyltransferase
VYRIDVTKQREFKKRLKKSFVTLRIVKLFYLILKYKQFRVLAQKAAKFDVPLKRTTVGH